MNWKGYVRKQRRSSLRYYPGMSGGTEETHKNSQDSQSLGQDFKPGSPAYKAGVLITQPICSTWVFKR
jgi:hypothetical protein